MTPDTPPGRRPGDRGERGRHGPPHWWPEGQPWPPPRRRGALTVLLRLLAVGFLLVVVAMVVAVCTFHGGEGGPPGPFGPGGPGDPEGGRPGFFIARAFVVGILAVVLLAILAGAVGARRIARPLDELSGAAERLERGDYSARVTEHAAGPPALRRFIRTFNTATARLQADEDQRRRLLANTSHELRTPLTVLQGEIEAMLDGVYPADQEHLALALDQTHLMARLIEDLRTLALAEAGTLVLHRESVDVAALAADVAAAFATVAARAEVRIDVDAPSEGDSEGNAVIEADPVRLRQVLDNLVGNALRYAPPDTPVTIEVAPLAGAVRVAVTDRGPGVPPDLLPRLFDRFQKSDESRGSGLGLAIARELVEAHGGTIRVDPAPVEGARFEFTLPASA